jgi:competence protein ComEC
MNDVIISFVDVGQGDCTIAADTSTGTGILIDCPAGQHQAAIHEIEERNCYFVAAAIISHTHADHSGGVLDVLETLDDRFYGDIFVNHDSFLATPVAGPDRAVAGKRVRAIFHRLREFPDRVKPAEEDASGSTGELSWRIIAPKHDEVLEAVDVGDPNRASTIVVLSAHSDSVLVGGDAQLKTWERIASQLPNGAMCRWPHHGGSIDPTNSVEAQRFLFAIVRPSLVVLSVGAFNTFGHPTSAFFHARKESRVRLLCTQATSSCVLGSQVRGPCAGSIRIVITPAGNSVILDAKDHQGIIDSWGAAQCVDDT